MQKLNLETKNKEQELIKDYLENNASEILAEKINNGIKFNKDNKTFINKKDLDSFMKYANEEARKLVEKNQNYACIEDKTVFGWAIHYFEEDEIIGTLYNEDGTLYEEIKPKTETKIIEKPKEKSKQPSLFDLIDLNNNQVELENKEIVQNNNINENKKEIIKNQIVDTETGEVLENEVIVSFDKEDAIFLSAILDNKLKLEN